MTSPYVAAPDRYEAMPYRRVGASGLRLPAISLGLWQNFGDDRPLANQRAIVRRAFDRGVTHFDLANNYGPPYGAAEANFGRILASDLHAHRDELIVSSKAGYDMWPGPYGDHGSRKYLLASLDQSLGRLGLEYVDIFYSHRVNPETPLEETMGALDAAVRQGKALYVGISSYSSARTIEAAALLRERGVPLLIHQPSYSMFNRWLEHDRLLDTLETVGAGCIAFSPLAQGLLAARDVVLRERARDRARRSLVVVLTDGRATGGPDPLGRTRSAARLLRAEDAAAVVVDCETSYVRLGLAEDLANHLGAPAVRLSELRADALTRLVKSGAELGAA